MPDWQNLDDEKLIRESQQGNSDAFGELYQRYAAPIFRYLLANIGNHQDAEDMTEDVFLRTWAAIPEYELRGYPFTAFIFRIARNVLTDHYRKNRQPELEMSVEDINLRDYSPTPDQSFSVQFEHQKLHHALGKLRKDYQAVLALRFLSGLSPEETAKVMERSVGAIRVLQYRALASLRQILDKDQK